MVTIIQRNKTEEPVDEYDIFVEHITSKRRIRAKVSLYPRFSRWSLMIKFKDNECGVKYENHFFHTLRLLDHEVNKEGYRIICNGTSIGTYPSGLSLSMSDGLNIYKLDTSEVLDTLAYSNWNQYATEEEQRLYYLEYIKKQARGMVPSKL